MSDWFKYSFDLVVVQGWHCFVVVEERVQAVDSCFADFVVGDCLIDSS